MRNQKHVERPEVVSEEEEKMILNAIRKRLGKEATLTEWIGCDAWKGHIEGYYVEGKLMPDEELLIFEVRGGELASVQGVIGKPPWVEDRCFPRILL